MKKIFLIWLLLYVSGVLFGQNKQTINYVLSDDFEKLVYHKLVEEKKLNESQFVGVINSKSDTTTVKFVIVADSGMIKNMAAITSHRIKVKEMYIPLIFESDLRLSDSANTIFPDGVEISSIVLGGFVVVYVGRIKHGKVIASFWSR